MKVLHLFIVTIAIVIVLSLVSVWSLSSLQDFMAGNRMWNGVRDFLRESDGNTIESLDVLAGLPPPETSLIVVPYLEYSSDELQSLNNFVEQGGHLLVMDDYGFGNSILEYFGVKIRFSGKPLLDPLFCYKNQFLPKVTDFSTTAPDGINVVVLNHATALQNVNDGEALAWSSPSSFLDIDEDEAWTYDEPKGPLPVAAEIRIGEGTLLLASDPSLVINSMVNTEDNSAFINGLISRGGEDKEIQLDISHLTKSPLDISKAGLISLRDVLASPYPLLAIIFVMFLAVSGFMLRVRRLN